MRKNAWLAGMTAVWAAVGLLSCATRHEVAVEPVEIKPIHITIDVNVRVERALEDFFSDIDQTAQQIKQAE